MDELRAKREAKGKDSPVLALKVYAAPTATEKEWSSSKFTAIHNELVSTFLGGHFLPMAYTQEKVDDNAANCECSEILKDILVRRIKDAGMLVSEEESAAFHKCMGFYLDAGEVIDDFWKEMMIDELRFSSLHCDSQIHKHIGKKKEKS